MPGISDHDLLLRIDERTDQLQKEVALITKDLKNNYVERRECAPCQSGMKDFVTHVEFAPVKKLVYGLIGAVLAPVVIALLGLILK